MNKHCNILITVAILVVSGCASNSGVIPIGNDTYIVSRQAASGFSGLGTLKADAMKEAYTECQKSGKTVDVIEGEESDSPYIFGNFPRVEVTFKCVAESEIN